MSYFEHAFTAELERSGVGKSRNVWYHVLFLPNDLAATLPFTQHPRLRVDGEIADVPVNSAFIPSGDQRHYVIVSPQVIKQAELVLGDAVDMRFTIADQDSVDVPPLLAEALQQDEPFRLKWDALTAGKKRGMCHHVHNAKTDPTKAKRVSDVAETVLQFDGNLRRFLDSRKKARSETI